MYWRVAEGADYATLGCVHNSTLFMGLNADTHLKEITEYLLDEGGVGSTNVVVRTIL